MEKRFQLLSWLLTILPSVFLYLFPLVTSVKIWSKNSDDTILIHTSISKDLKVNILWLDVWVFLKSSICFSFIVHQLRDLEDSRSSSRLSFSSSSNRYWFPIFPLLSIFTEIPRRRRIRTFLSSRNFLQSRNRFFWFLNSFTWGCGYCHSTESYWC